jgi:DNA polymerase I-like protein with 3'-5' exonuclease and polymerase domains
MLLTSEQLDYAARDVEHLHALKEKLETEIAAAQLKAVCELEMALCPAVVAMEETWISVNVPKFKTLRDEAQKQADLAAAQVRSLLGAPNLNPASPEQLKSALNRHGIAVADTT